MKSEWIWSKVYDERFWDNYPLGIQYNFYEKLLLFDTISKRKLDAVSTSGGTIYGDVRNVELLKSMCKIVTHNIEQLELSIADNENAISDCVFGTESYFLN